MTRSCLLICSVVLGLCVPSAAAVAAPVDPVPLAGDWTDGAAAKAHGARAVVTFSVAEGTGLVQPTVDYRLRRCAGVAKRWSEKISLGSVAVNGDAFAVRDRHRHRKARVTLRLRGVFDTETDAHGWVRGKVTFRGGGGRRAVTCALPKLTWSTSLAWAEDDEGSEDGDDEFADDEEFVEDDVDPGADEDVDPDEGP
jgi:hypothetical protein